MRNFDLASDLIEIARINGADNFDVSLCYASLLGLNARYEEAKTELEKVNKLFPMQKKILTRLLQVCEQLRDYNTSAGYLRLWSAQGIHGVSGTMKQTDCCNLRIDQNSLWINNEN